MQIATPKQRVILDAAIDCSVIRGTLTAPTRGRRDFHGWLELTTALEAMLDTRADHAPTDGPAASGAVQGRGAVLSKQPDQKGSQPCQGI
jgi:hypothetical protein